MGPLRFLIILTILAPHSESGPDFTTVVYKDCANQSSSDPTGAFSQALSSLFGTLISQSSNSKFFKAAAGSGHSAVDGLFQCRGDLSNADCHACVSNLPILIDRLCGEPVAAARMHLYGCYMLYEVSGSGQISGMEMLYKSCSQNDIGGSGFEEKRDTALSSLENGVGPTGFYAAKVDSVNAMGQCEGDLGVADCADCVRTAVQRAQVECGSSASGQVYLHKCYIGYGDYAYGSPKGSSSASASSDSSSSSSSSFGSGAVRNPGKTVAVILGGAAAVGFLVICLLFARGTLKKKDGY